MRIVCLNTWRGNQGDLFWEFIRSEREQADVFLLQEVTQGDDTALLETLKEELLDFVAVFAGTQHGLRDLPEHIDYGPATFVRSNLPIESSDITFVNNERDAFYGDFTSIPRNVLSVRIPELTLMNFHGLVDGEKNGTPIVTEQIEHLIDVVNGAQPPLVLMGDFNIRPKTDAMDLVRATGLRDLITEYGIELTRSPLYDGVELYGDTISDYSFVSPELKVTSFDVPRIEASDHLPLILEIELPKHE